VGAELSVPHHPGHDNQPILCLYPVRVDQYPETAADEFKFEVMLKMKEWLDSELTKPETTQVGRVENLVAEWTGDQHRFISSNGVKQRHFFKGKYA
jgi:hypothetical protein